MEMSPRKSSFRHAQKIVMPALSARIAAKLLHSQPHEKSAIHEIYDPYREARWGFVSWYLLGVRENLLSLQWVSEIPK
jgi:hypothetical protein